MIVYEYRNASVNSPALNLLLFKGIERKSEFA